eukprot:762947-Hanusia_phi.AAC.3
MLAFAKKCSPSRHDGNFFPSSSVSRLMLPLCSPLPHFFALDHDLLVQLRWRRRHGAGWRPGPARVPLLCGNKMLSEPGPGPGSDSGGSLRGLNLWARPGGPTGYPGSQLVGPAFLATQASLVNDGFVCRFPGGEGIQVCLLDGT